MEQPLFAPLLSGAITTWSNFYSRQVPMSMRKTEVRRMPKLISHWSVWEVWNTFSSFSSLPSGTLWTSLHAATFQEHGKVVHTLCCAGANIHIKDKGGITPIDFASISEAVWPHFGAKGADKTPKAELLAKSIIRKIAKGESRRPESRIQSLSQRPGRENDYFSNTMPFFAMTAYLYL